MVAERRLSELQRAEEALVDDDDNLWYPDFLLGAQ